MNDGQHGLCSHGKITSGIVENQHIVKIVDFVYQALPVWRDDTDRFQAGSEPRLNETLCDLLTVRAKKLLPLFHFTHEASAKGRRRTDLAVKPDEHLTLQAITYGKYDTLVAIECKRLPAPAREREREYVSGGNKKTGGIQRFKLSEHGAGLPVAVMVGYIQSLTPNDWVAAINRWILELAESENEDGLSWSGDEKLAEFKNDRIMRTARARSRHPRVGQQDHRGDHIQIEHLWVVLSEAAG